MKVITFRQEPRLEIGYRSYTHRLTPGRPYVFFDREIEKIKDHAACFEVREMEPKPSLYRGETLEGKSLLFASLGGYGDALCFLQALHSLQSLYPGAEIDICSHMDIYLFIRQFGFRGGWLNYPLKLRDLKPYDYYQTSDSIYGFAGAFRENIARLYGKILHVAPDVSRTPFTPVDIPETVPAGGKGKKKIAIQVNTEKGTHRNYPADKVLRLARLLGDAGCEVFLVGNVSLPAGRNGAKGVHDYIGRTSTPLELAGLLNRMDAVVTPDSLSAHIGGTLGIPTLVIFNVTGREKTDHYPSVIPLTSGLACSPCHDLFGCPQGYGTCRALDEASLSPETVCERVVSLIQRPADLCTAPQQAKEREIRAQ